jgi:ribonuclease P protein component
MRGEQYLTRPAQFDAVYKKGSSWVDKLVVMKALRNGMDISRWGFSVSGRMGGAVVRNRIKRRLREILTRSSLKPGWDIVFITRTPAAEASFSELADSVGRLLARACIAEPEINHKGDTG